MKHGNSISKSEVRLAFIPKCIFSCPSPSPPMKSDERILGDRDFAQSVLDACKEQYEEAYRLQSQGYDLEQITNRVSFLLDIDPKQVWADGKHRHTVKERSLLCYWAVRKLGISATELSKKLGLSQPSVSISVKRGEKIAQAEQLKLVED